MRDETCCFSRFLKAFIGLSSSPCAFFRARRLFKNATDDFFNLDFFYRKVFDAKIAQKFMGDLSDLFFLYL